MTVDMIGKARDSGSTTLTRQHFVNFWVGKTGMNALASPFTHFGFEPLFRPDKPSHASIL